MDPEVYLDALRSVGFVDVEMKTIEMSGGQFQAVCAHKKGGNDPMNNML